MSNTDRMPINDNLALDGLDQVFAVKPADARGIDFAGTAPDVTPAQDVAFGQAAETAQNPRVSVSVEGQGLCATDLATLLDALRNIIRKDVLPELNNRNEEIEELRKIVIEAKDTIIRLLTDRVNDRAQIARLETEMKFLPDLQAQSDRAFGIICDTEALREDVNEVREELAKSRVTRMRGHLSSSRAKRTWWSNVCAKILGEDQ